MNIKVIFVLLFICIFPVRTLAGDNFDIDLGVVIGSYHFKNSFEHSKDFNESNVGPTVYWKDINDIVPGFDEFSLSYIHYNSFEENSIYLFFYNNLMSSKDISFDIAIGAATGYEKHIELASDLGFMPFFGLRVTLFSHLELGIIPSGLVDEKGVNVLTATYRF